MVVFVRHCRAECQEHRINLHLVARHKRPSRTCLKFCRVLFQSLRHIGSWINTHGNQMHVLPDAVSELLLNPAEGGR